MPRIGAAAILLALALAGGARAQDHRIVLPDDVVPDHYEIAVTPDAAGLTFTGQVRIDLTVRRPTDRIVLNDADIVIDRAALSGQAAAPAIIYDPAVQTATFTLGHPLAPGHYSLSLAYHGRIYQQASGLFALDYQAGSTTKRALFTQFENSDARRFVPCWDEPARKATFTLTVTAPADQMAVSNMPVAEASPLPGGLQRVRFAETPKMSSYLLFLALGDFERVHRMVDGVDVGVVVKRGDTAKAAYALDVEAQVLPYYNRYFAKPYPLPKLDLVAGPGSSQFFGAMENWGAIFFFERGVLVDPRISTDTDRRGVYTVVAHETAHQWFGDLVTMAWWDDLWLNEGFASWMEVKVADHFHPEWTPWLLELGDRDWAMQTDARAVSHPIITPIDDVLQAGSAFDEITYQKGAAVIRMLEAYVGPDVFREGVRRYIAAHAYGNTVTDDLWREIDPVSPGRPITAIAHDFTLQAGVPLVAEEDARCENGRTRVTLKADRFVTGPPPNNSATWRIPVVAGVAGQAASEAVVAAPGAELDLAGCGPVILNQGQAGYFRSLYSSAGEAALIARFGQLSTADQLGVIDDARALGWAGRQPMAAYLDLTARLDAGADPILWSRIAGDLAGLDQLYDDQPGQARFRAYARAVLAPAMARVGWDAKPGEGDNIALMRGAVLGALARMDDPAVLAEAHRRFQLFLADQSSLSPPVRSATLGVIASHADAHDWEQLLHLARTAHSDVERRDFYQSLGAARDPALARRALELSLSGEVAPTTAPGLIGAVSGRYPAMALDFATAHWNQVSRWLEPDSRPGYAPGLASSAADPALIRTLDAFAAGHIPENARLDLRKAEAMITYRADLRANRLPEVDRWLASRDQPRPR